MKNLDSRLNALERKDNDHGMILLGRNAAGQIIHRSGQPVSEEQMQSWQNQRRMIVVFKPHRPNT